MPLDTGRHFVSEKAGVNIKVQFTLFFDSLTVLLSGQYNLIKRDGVSRVVFQS